MKKLLKKEHCVNGVACCIILLLLTLALLRIHMEYVDVHGDGQYHLFLGEGGCP